VVDGLIRDDGFRVYRHIVERDEDYRRRMADIPDYLPPEQEARDVQEYCKILVETLPALRNDLAHGSGTLHPGGYKMLAICCDLINQLYG
jgi:hypothetical protein